MNSRHRFLELKHFSKLTALSWTFRETAKKSGRTFYHRHIEVDMYKGFDFLIIGTYHWIRNGYPCTRWYA